MKKTKKIKKNVDSGGNNEGMEDEGPSMDQPDPDDPDFYHDDIDNFDLDKDKILFDDDDENDDESSNEEEEVYGVHVDSEGDDDDSDDDDDDSDSSVHEEKKGHEKMPSEKAWGKSKTAFYNTDINSDEDSEDDFKVQDMYEEEEEEALKIQQRMASMLDPEDFGFDSLIKQMKQPIADEDKQIVKQDLSELNQKQKIQLLKKESPEITDLVKDLQTKVSELSKRWFPLQAVMKKKGFTNTGKASEYVNLKVLLYLNYCANISFYLSLKSKRTPVEDHPIILRLLSYKTLINKLNGIDKTLGSVFDQYLDDHRHVLEAPDQPEESIPTTTTTTTNRPRKRKEALPSVSAEKLSDDTALEYYNKIASAHSANKRQKTGEVIPALYEDEMLELSDKREISSQIARNKGLTPKRNKDLKNPRVKHRMKYRRAKIRRKGQVREVRPELNRYPGELSGIRIGIKKGTKIR